MARTHTVADHADNCKRHASGHAARNGFAEERPATQQHADGLHMPHDLHASWGTRLTNAAVSLVHVYRFYNYSHVPQSHIFNPRADDTVGYLITCSLQLSNLLCECSLDGNAIKSQRWHVKQWAMADLRRGHSNSWLPLGVSSCPLEVLRDNDTPRVAKVHGGQHNIIANR